ncbi:hypothetical protein [Halomonas organivorans]|uniref:Uncharacterized protein n=1 Tax=Halomonas organivorans TaxID=257772 RepID=A0A7W5BUX5_9GAMM|nr:hypothetical protein [Halomonas organivorans]MBB3139585.1 hypothetical protein [Halomonas organivorans]
MTDRRQGRDQNAAWLAAEQWRERARRARPTRGMSGPRMILTWLLFGAMMIVGTLIGLVFLLIGWLMLPFLRHRMKKRMERMRADQAQDVGGGTSYRETHYQETHYRQSRGRDERTGKRERDVLEGDYEVKDRDGVD